MTHITLKTTTMVHGLAALGLFSLPMAAPSMGASIAASQPVTNGASELFGGAQASLLDGISAKVLTRIEVLNGDRDVIVRISGDGPLRYERLDPDGKRLVVDVLQVSSLIQEPAIKVGHPLLKRVRVGLHNDRVRVVFDRAMESDYTIDEQVDTLLVRFSQRESRQEATAINERSSRRLALSQAVETEDSPWQGFSKIQRTTPVKTVGRQAVPAFHIRPVQMATDGGPAMKFTPKEDLVVGETRYSGRRISLDFQQAEISNVLRLIAEVSGFNIVIGDGVKSKVTMKLVSVPWDQALDMILKMNGLGKIKQGNILWIDTLANIAKQEDEEARAKEAKSKAEPLVDRVFYIRNLQAQELMTSLRQNLSPRGRIQISQGSNALVVQDTESRINVIKRLIDGLDLEVPQVQIEARIVQADTVYARGLGVQWGIKNTDFSSNGFSAFGNLTGPFAPVAGTGGTIIPRDFLVNLPAQVAGLPAVPAVGYSFGKLADGFALDLRLSAGELLGLAKVIAAPKVTTLDKREAKISQGESIPFQTTSLQGTQTTFVDANLELNVTPQITSRDPNEEGKRIMMKVRATRNAVGARSNPAGPSIDRREANTQVLVRDGETMVIGGVFIDTQNNNVQGVPYLSRIPVLGWLFKNKSESVSKQELLIFLTPTIVKSI